MNAAVVFFSYQGTTQRIAEELAKELDAKTIPISIVDTGDTPETYTWRDHLVQLSPKPEISHTEFVADEYDLIVLGTPVWSGSMAPAIRSFLDVHEFFRRTLALFCSYERRVGNALSEIRRALSGNTILDEARFRTIGAETLPPDHIRRWARSLVTLPTHPEIEEASLGRTTA